MEVFLTDGLGPYERGQLLDSLEERGQEILAQINPEGARDGWGESVSAQASQRALLTTLGVKVQPKPEEQES